jgi:hypothetical protein
MWHKALNPSGALDLPQSAAPLISHGEQIVSAGSCFAANIVPYLEAAGFNYVRAERLPAAFGRLVEDNFSYAKFSAAYGNVYTARQAWQLLARALGRFKPAEDRWHAADGTVIDPFRPGLRHRACSDVEFDALTAQHLSAVRSVIERADVFVFTLGLTEAWESALDGAVFPACPGTVAGEFDPQRHRFHNFNAQEVGDDMDRLIALAREINPALRLVLTVSPVPLVAAAGGQNVVLATVYSKSVLRVAAGEAEQRHDGVTYFPSFEIVCGPQAPHDFFEADRRTPSERAIRTVMRAFLAQCDTSHRLEDEPPAPSSTASPASASGSLQAAAAGATPVSAERELSNLIVGIDCEEAASVR